MKNCNECKWISLTEEQQTNRNVPHICLKYKVRVFHSSNQPKVFHGYLYPCDECNGNDFEQRCKHKNTFSYNHGYHTICLDCGEKDWE